MRASSQMGLRLLWNSALNCPVFLLDAGAPGCTAAGFILAPQTVKGPFIPQSYQISTLHWMIFLPCSPKGSIFYRVNKATHQWPKSRTSLLSFYPLICLTQTILLGTKNPSQTALSSGGYLPFHWANWWPQKMSDSTTLHLFLPPINRR